MTVNTLNLLGSKRGCYTIDVGAVFDQERTTGYTLIFACILGTVSCVVIATLINTLT